MRRGIYIFDKSTAISRTCFNLYGSSFLPPFSGYLSIPCFICPYFNWFLGSEPVDIVCNNHLIQFLSSLGIRIFFSYSWECGGAVWLCPKDLHSKSLDLSFHFICETESTTWIEAVFVKYFSSYRYFFK